MFLNSRRVSLNIFYTGFFELCVNLSNFFLQRFAEFHPRIKLVHVASGSYIRQLLLVLFK